MLNYLRSTKFKIRSASLLYRLLRMVGIRSNRLIDRGGIRYRVDLAEGIDLSLFLFGNFQKHVIHSGIFKLRNDAVAIDVGANFGVISLMLAKQLPLAKIYAFEPTDYAYEKLKINISINSGIRDRIEALQFFISDHEEGPKKLKVYSSWRVDKKEPGRHPVHCGSPKMASGATITIDRFVRDRGLGRLDFIKIDTDGYELTVLRGAQKSIRRFRPVIVFEISTYLLDENDEKFSDFLNILEPIGYKIFDSVSGNHIEEGNLRNHVPGAGSTDLVAIPSES